MQPAMSSVKTVLTARRKKRSASTRGASVDACSGKSGSEKRASITSGVPPGATRALGTSQREERERAAGPHRAHDERAVLAGGGVVVEAEEEELIDRRADLARRGLDQPQAEIARRRLDAVEVARDGTPRRRHDGHRDVRELPPRRVGGVAEADRAREAVDRRLLARQEVPARGGVEPSVARQLGGL